MKLITCLFQLLAICSAFINVYAQNDIAIPGVIVMHNSQYNTGHKEYVAFATVRSTGKCTPTSSDSKGEFTLVFADKPAGDVATLFVKKDGLEVVNTKDLEEATVIGRLTPLKVFMCKQGELEANKELYYLISDSAIQKIYETRLKALLQKQGKEYNAVIASLTKEMNRNIKDADEAIATLNEQLQSQKKQVKELVDQFAIENLDDQSETYQKAFAAFSKGNIDEALFILDKVDLGKRLEKNAEQIQKAKSAISNLNENIISKEEQMQQDIDQALLDARMHKLKYQFEETEISYDLVIKYDSTNFEYLKEYYFFLSYIKNYEKAIKVLKDALIIFKNLNQDNSLMKWHVALIEGILGFAYMSNDDLLNAEEAHKECLRIEKELVKIDPWYYEPKIALQKTLLGMVYSERNDTLKAEAIYMEALAIQKRLVQRDTQYYMQDVAATENILGILYSETNLSKAEAFFEEALKLLQTYAQNDHKTLVLVLHNLGNLYKKKRDFQKSENAYKEALRIYKNEAQIDPLQFEPDVADVQVDLGALYYEKKDYINAEIFYLQALEINDNLVKSNAHGFASKVADIKSKLGMLYDKVKNYEKAESFYFESLNIYKRLSQSNPKKYEPEVGRIQRNLGLMYQNKKDYANAESAFLIALTTREQLAKTDSSLEEDVAITQNDLGILYDKKRDYTKSEAAYLKAFDIYQQLALKNPQLYEPKIARTENNLGLMYRNKKDYENAKSAFLIALAMRERLAKTDSSFEDDVADTQNDLGNLYLDKKDYALCEVAYLKSLEIYKRLSLKNPDLYEPEVATTQNNIGLLYMGQKDFLNAEITFLNTMQIRERLALKDPDTYQISIFETQTTLIGLYQDIIDSLNTDTIKLKYHDQIVSLYQKLKIKSLVENPLKNVEANTCGNLSWYLLFIKNFEDAETAAHWGLQIDSSEVWIKTNLAHSLLFQGRYTEAEKEYLNLKEIKDDQNGKLYKSIFLEDLDALEKAGITHPDIKKIRALLSR